MKTKLLICPIILSLASVAAAEEVKGGNSADVFAEYLSSMSRESREKLASKLYYLDPRLEKGEAKKNLLDALKEQGRVKDENSLSSSPRTISTESGI